MNDNQLSGLVVDLLSRHDFRKRGRLLRRAGAEVVCLVELQKHRWSELRYVNVGLNFVGPMASVELVRTSDISVRLDSVASEARSDILEAFDLGASVDDELRRDRVEAIVVGVLVPWCERASTVSGLCEMVRDGALPAAFLTLVARRYLSTRCEGISAEPE